MHLEQTEQMKRCLFHTPMPIDPSVAAGSRVRPLNLRAGFEQIGYQVDTIWGYGAERKRAIEIAKQNVRSGGRYDFLYSESSTMPTMLTEKHHFPSYPCLDFAFFRFCCRNKIPVGLFYRDVYWQFDRCRRSIRWYKRLVTVPCYHLDLLAYRHWVDVLFLPSVQMSSYVHYWPKEKPIYALPPGGVLAGGDSVPPRIQKLRLLYIGGVCSPLYDIGNLLEGVHRAVLAGANIHLTICCPREHWEARPMFYNDWLGGWLTVVHLSGTEAQEMYQHHDIAMVYRVSTPYLEFAMPVKVFEALGQGKPIITMNSTVVSEFIQEQGCGWNVSPESDALAGLLQRLAGRPQEVAEKTRVTQRVRVEHTWAKRAERAASILTAIGRTKRQGRGV